MLISSPVLAVLATLGAYAQAQQRVECDRRQYADLANKIRNTAYFCVEWLRVPRRGRVTPVSPTYAVRSLTRLCQCHVQNAPRVQGPINPIDRPAVRGCPVSLYRPLINQYRDPKQFCRWYNAIGGRERSPIPAIVQPSDVYQACRCLLNNRFAAQQTTTTRRTTTEEEPEPTDEPEPTEEPTGEPPVATTTSGLIDPIGGTRTTTTSTGPTSTVAIPTIIPSDATTAAPTSEATSAATEATSSGTSTAGGP